MTAVTQPIAEDLATTHAAKQGGSQSFGWLGTSCRLCLLGVLIAMHLPMLIFIGVIAAIGALARKHRRQDACAGDYHQSIGLLTHACLMPGQCG